MAPSPSTALAVLTPDTAEKNYPALWDGEGGGEFADLIAANLGDDSLSPSDLPLIKIPTGGGLQFEVGDEGDTVKELKGVIVHWGTGRVWYEKSFEDRDAEGTGAPDCSSPDGKIGIGRFGVKSTENPTGQCEGCPMNEWGSARQGKGKACNEQKQVWMLLEPAEGEEPAVFPTQVRLSPGSLAAFKKYRTALLMKRTHYAGVVTKITLERVKNDRGTAYSRVVLTRVERLDAETTERAKAFGRTVEQMLRDNPQVMSDGAGEGSPTGPAAAGVDPTGDDPWATEPTDDVQYEDEPPRA